MIKKPAFYQIDQWNMLSLLEPFQKVDVYRNLTSGLWSVRQNGIVILHAECIAIYNPEFIVSQKGRAKVIRKQKKYVHAYVRGFPTFLSGKRTRPVNPTVLTYNPYIHESFVDEQGNPVYNAGMCVLRPDHKVEVVR